MFTGYTPVQNNNAQYLSMIMNLLEKAGSTIGSAMKTGQQNQVANAFMQQGNSGANAPRAAAVDPSQIPAGVPTQGTAPMYPTNPQGQLMGTPELSMAMQLQKQQAAQNDQNAQMALRQQQLANMQQENRFRETFGTTNPGANQGRGNTAQQSEWGT